MKDNDCMFSQNKGLHFKKRGGKAFFPLPSGEILICPSKMADFLSEDISRWLAQNSSACAIRSGKEIQKQIEEMAESFRCPSTSVTESLRRYNELMGKMGFHLSDHQLCRQIHEASFAVEKRIQMQLQQFIEKVEHLQSKKSLGQISLDSTCHKMYLVVQQLSSLASGISSAAKSIYELESGLEKKGNNSTRSDLLATFSSILSSADDFNALIQGAIGFFDADII